MLWYRYGLTRRTKRSRPRSPRLRGQGAHKLTAYSDHESGNSQKVWRVRTLRLVNTNYPKHTPANKMLLWEVDHHDLLFSVNV